jgi:hypothetical protein
VNPDAEYLRISIEEKRNQNKEQINTCVSIKATGILYEAMLNSDPHKVTPDPNVLLEL